MRQYTVKTTSWYFFFNLVYSNLQIRFLIWWTAKSFIFVWTLKRRYIDYRTQVLFEGFIIVLPVNDSEGFAFLKCKYNLTTIWTWLVHDQILWRIPLGFTGFNHKSSSYPGELLNNQLYLLGKLLVFKTTISTVGHQKNPSIYHSAFPSNTGSNSFSHYQSSQVFFHFIENRVIKINPNICCCNYI